VVHSGFCSRRRSVRTSAATETNFEEPVRLALEGTRHSSGMARVTFAFGENA
jgi:hypothetical protein